MSKLSYIYSSYGKEFNIAVANTWSENVLNAVSLPPMTMIMSSPYDVMTGEDLGLHNLFVTDEDGTPIRLTYAMKTGNGLVLENDTLSLKIDEHYLTTGYNGELSLNVGNILDNESLVLDNGYIKGNAQVLRRSSKERYGVVKVDGFTLKSNHGKLSVETSNLDLADNSTSSKGIIYASEESILKINSGIVSVNTEKITNASKTTYGVAKVDGTTIISNNGLISASINGMHICSNSDYGLAKEDNNSIYCDNNGILSADFNYLDGWLIKVDNNTVKVNNDGLMTIQDGAVSEAILSIGREIDQINNRINVIETIVEDYSPKVSGPMIFSFTCNGLASAMLNRPSEYGELAKDMPSQQISAEFTVRTNCPFRVYIDYLDNDTPQILLYEINYNDIDIYSGNSGLAMTFQSTEEKDATIKFAWLCKNYASNNNMEYSKKTRINIEVRAADDASVKKSVKYSILRYNSMYNTDVDYSAHNEEILVNKGKSKKGVTNGAFRLMTKNNDITLFNVGNINDNAIEYNILTTNVVFGTYTRNNVDYVIVKEKRTGSLEKQSFYGNGSLKASNYAYLGLVDDLTGMIIPITSIDSLSVVCTDDNGNETNDVSVSIGPNGVLQLTYNGPLSYKNTLLNTGQVAYYGAIN